MLRPSTSFMDLPQPTGIAVPWCTADAVHGRDRKLREYCKQHTIGCALGVPCSFRVTLPSRAKVRVDATLKILTSHSWQIASCGAGLQRRPSLRLRLPGHRRSAPLPAHPPQLDQPGRGGVPLLLRPRTRPGHPRRARRGVWTTLDRRRRRRIRQGPVRIRTQPPPANLGLIPPTVVEVKRLFNLLTRTWRTAEHYLHWSQWRRRHQARARWYHHRARLT
jgi:hypothetical protein